MLSRRKTETNVSSIVDFHYIKIVVTCKWRRIRMKCIQYNAAVCVAVSIKRPVIDERNPWFSTQSFIHAFFTPNSLQIVLTAVWKNHFQGFVVWKIYAALSYLDSNEKIIDWSDNPCEQTTNDHTCGSTSEVHREVSSYRMVFEQAHE